MSIKTIRKTLFQDHQHLAVQAAPLPYGKGAYSFEEIFRYVAKRQTNHFVSVMVII